MSDVSQLRPDGERRGRVDGADRSADTAGRGEALRVAYLTQWFPPEPVKTPLWIAESLRRQGLAIDVLTGVPNFPSGQVQDGFSAWRPSREIRDGFRVLRAPLYPSHDRSTVKRAANYASYALSSSMFGSPMLRSADVALIYSSPATAATAAMVSRTPYVLLIQDLWPDSIFATGFMTSGPARRLAERLLTLYTRETYRRAAHVAVIAPGMRSLLVDRGVPPDRVSVVYNWVDENVMRPMAPDPNVRARLGLDGGFVLMYAGNHGPAQALDIVIQAMGRLRNLPDLHLVLVGDGIDKPALRSLAGGLELASVHFLDPVQSERVPSTMAAADLQLVSLADEDLFRVTMPSKVQSIMACGQPILSCAPGDASEVVEAAAAGLTCLPGDPNKLAQSIRQAYNMSPENLRDMGRAGYDFYTSTMSEAINARALANLLEVAAKTRKGAARAR